MAAEGLFVFPVVLCIVVVVDRRARCAEQARTSHELIVGTPVVVSPADIDPIQDVGEAIINTIVASCKQFPTDELRGTDGGIQCKT